MHDVTNTWLVTEVLFAETILKDELIMLIKVFKETSVQPKTN